MPNGEKKERGRGRPPKFKDPVQLGLKLERRTRKQLHDKAEELGYDTLSDPIRGLLQGFIDGEKVEENNEKVEYKIRLPVLSSQIEEETIDAVKREFRKLEEIVIHLKDLQTLPELSTDQYKEMRKLIPKLYNQMKQVSDLLYLD